MKASDIIALAGIFIATIAALISVFVLLQMRQDTDIARRDSELRIRPILFIKDVKVNLESDDDQIGSIDALVVNSGLGPALNVKTKVGEDIRLPGSGAVLKADLFEDSAILQVLPNTSSVAGSANTTFNVASGGSIALYGGISGIPEIALQSTSPLRIPVAKRPDGQAQLKLHSLNLTEKEFEGAIRDALFITSATSMTNAPIAYKNRPKRSDTIEEVK